MMCERGLSVAHTTIYRWVMAYSPEINKRCRPYLRSSNDSCPVDETYLKVKGKNHYLYRAIDSKGNTLDFFLSPKRDGEAATRFLWKALSQGHSRTPRVINTDKDKAYPKTVKDLKESGILHDSVKHRAIKYLNNLIEQDHRFIKLRIIASQNFRSIKSARKTISGYESINMIRKGQIKNVKRDDISGQIKRYARANAFALAPSAACSLFILYSGLLCKIGEMASKFETLLFFCTLILTLCNTTRFLKQCRSQGYTVNLIYVWLESPELAVSRVAKRVASKVLQKSELLT